MCTCLMVGVPVVRGLASYCTYGNPPRRATREFTFLLAYVEAASGALFLLATMYAWSGYLPLPLCPGPGYSV